MTSQRTRPARNPPWNREELILALDVYHHADFPNGRIAKTHPDVETLSRDLGSLTSHEGADDPIRFRNPSGVYMKVQNFKSFDPYYLTRGRRGLSNTGKLDREIWSEFENDLEGLRDAARSVRSGIHQGSVIPVRPTPTRRPGRTYIRANEDPDPDSLSKTTLTTINLGALDRSTKAHAHLQNALEHWLSERGFATCSPDPDDPEFDLAWWQEDVFHVVEVKSLTDENEEQQLRLGLGQLLHYRFTLRQRAIEVVGVLAVERQPRDSSWMGICDQVGVILTWPDLTSSFAHLPKDSDTAVLA